MEAVPFVPAVTVPHAKLVMVSATEMVLPADPREVLLTVVAAPVEVAVTPTAGKLVLQLLIAVARSAATAVVPVSLMKVPALALVQPFAADAGMLAALRVISVASLVEIAIAVAVVFVIVMTALFTVASTVGAFVLIEPSKLLASVAVMKLLVT